jgi:fatty-acid desaturase
VYQSLLSAKSVAISICIIIIIIIIRHHIVVLSVRFFFWRVWTTKSFLRKERRKHFCFAFLGRRRSQEEGRRWSEQIGKCEDEKQKLSAEKK